MRGDKASLYYVAACVAVSIAMLGAYAWIAHSPGVPAPPPPSFVHTVPNERLALPIPSYIPLRNRLGPETTLVVRSANGNTGVELNFKSIPSLTSDTYVEKIEVQASGALQGRINSPPAVGSRDFPKSVTIEHSRLPDGTTYRKDTMGAPARARAVIPLQLPLEAKHCGERIELYATAVVHYLQPHPALNSYAVANTGVAGNFTFFVHCEADLELRAGYEKWLSDTAGWAERNGRSPSAHAAIILLPVASAVSLVAAFVLAFSSYRRRRGAA